MKAKEIKITVILIILGFWRTSCTDFLDVVPDNVPTVDHAFNKRYQAEGFLYGLYSFLPNHANIADNPAFFAGDEAWLFKNFENERYFNARMWTIAIGEQGTESPIANYWASSRASHDLNGGKPLFTGIRDCNIFLENAHKPIDLEESERVQWIAEAKFLKAYYHFWLLRMYGPIPIIKENTPIHYDAEHVAFYREPVDSVFNYIVALLDEASQDLPLEVVNLTENLGRATKPIALSLKAKALTYAASPFFNGNTDYADMVDNRGINLFPQNYESEKWKRAAEALIDAIEVCQEAGHRLYDFQNSGVASTLNEKTVLAMNVRGAATELWNEEMIWANPNSTTVGRGPTLQYAAMPAFNVYNIVFAGLSKSYAPTLRVVEQFYTKNGVTIEEDKDWIDVSLYELQKGDSAHQYYIQEDRETINLHFNREARFYGAITFDGSKYYGNGKLTDKDLWTTELKAGTPNELSKDYGPVTGYLVRKIVHRLTSISKEASTPTYFRYAFPVIRLADLYLMLAEALNEYKETPDGEVYEYIDLVRNRTGLDGVVESWANHSIEPGKPLSKIGMRDIIRRERLNELAFEGHRFWDLRRWKLAEEYMSKPIRGLSPYEKEAEEFFKVQILETPVFEKKDYLWPIRQTDLTLNNNLIQNPGW